MEVWGGKAGLYGWGGGGGSKSYVMKEIKPQFAPCSKVGFETESAGVVSCLVFSLHLIPNAK